MAKKAGRRAAGKIGRATRQSRPGTKGTKGTKDLKGAPKPGRPLVGILYGSSSDESIVKECLLVLERFGISHEARLLSAHRMPESSAAYAKGARKRGLKVMICIAGMAAHLPGVIASMTTLPVIGVPVCGSALEGLDALYSMVQMPAGVPVATMAIGKAGAKNAALLAVQILALSGTGVVRRLDDLKRKLEAGEKM